MNKLQENVAKNEATYSSRYSAQNLSSLMDEAENLIIDLEDMIQTALVNKR